MATAAAEVAREGVAQPKLVFFTSSRSGNCRRVEGFLAQVLQRRRNHGTFDLYRVEEDERPDLLERFHVDHLPTLVVVEAKTVRGRLESPRGCREIERFLAPWLH
jgi:thioredoxin-like negative regulator of GroEL